MNENDEAVGRLLEALASSLPCEHEVHASRLTALLGALAARAGGTVDLTPDELRAVAGRQLEVKLDAVLGARVTLTEPETRH